METLHDALGELLERQRGMNLSPRTSKSLRSAAGLFIRWLERAFGVDAAADLRPAHLQAYQKHLATLLNRKMLPMKPGSVNGRVKAVKTLAQFLSGKGRAAHDLEKHIAYVKTPKLLPTSVLAHAQMRKLMRAVDTSTLEGRRDRAILELLYTSGVRGAELVGVKIEDVDLDAAVMKVMGKGSKERFVPIGRTAMRWLTTYIRGVRPFIKGSSRHRELFINRRGVPYGIKSLQAIVPCYAGKAGIEVRTTPHTFRRSCATEMIRGGANIYHVKELLGHECVETLKPYIKLTIHDLIKTHAKCHPRERDGLPA